MLLIISVGGIFAALNAKPVEINYFFGTKSFPLVILLLISLIIGSLLSFLILGFGILRLQAKNKWLAYKLKQVATVQPGVTQQ